MSKKKTQPSYIEYKPRPERYKTNAVPTEVATDREADCYYIISTSPVINSSQGSKQAVSHQFARQN